MTNGTDQAHRAADLAETVDWSATPLGPRETWPAGLEATARTVLGAGVPMALACGPDLVLLYNDAYTEIIGAHHPAAFGRPAAEVFAESWRRPGHGDVVERVFRTGEPFHEAETVLPVRRGPADAPVENVVFSRVYTAVRDVDDEVVAVLTVITELSSLARTLGGLADLAIRLSTALTVDDVAREALAHAVGALGADHARVLLSEGPSMRMARRAQADPHDESMERLPPLWARIPSSTHLPSVHAARTGQSLWLHGDELAEYDALRAEPIGPEPLQAAAVVALHDGGMRGAYSLGWLAPRDFTAAERDTIVTVGRLIGQAMSRAARFDEQRGNADMLQRSMLPPDLPNVPGVGIGARYEPSAPGTSAGGDFYDAFTRPDGRLVVVIGDVVGHGVYAAAVMGQLRAAVRVLAQADAEPSRVLSRLDEFVDSLGPEMLATTVVGVLDPVTRRIDVASAGHPPPLLRSGATGKAAYVDLPLEPPIGLAGPRSTHSVTLEHGDSLLLYTDGLVEVPGEDLDSGLERLRELMSGPTTPTDPRRMCGSAVEHLGSGTDDIAVLVVTLDAGERRTAEATFPPETMAPGAARAWVIAALTGWALAEDVVDTAVLGVNELVTNALLHARSSARVELDLDDRRLLVLVTDSGLGSPPTQQEADPEAMRGRGLLLIEALTDAWGSEQSSRGTTVWFELARHVAG